VRILEVRVAPDDADPGPIEAAVHALLSRMELGADRAVYAAMCVELARTLDDGAGQATAAVNRELRETVKALTAGEGDDADDAARRDLLARLSAPLGNTKN
jgi:hypothetical protein